MTDLDLTETVEALRYHVTTRVNGRTIGDARRSIPDPFARTVVTVGWRDLLVALWRRRLVVEVHVDGDIEAIRHVMRAPASTCGDDMDLMFGEAS